ncbi:MAG: tail fiber domain-containing protein [Pseudomonadota bacterium]
MKLNAKLKGLATSAAALAVSAGVASADIVQNDDVIISFSLCVGNDCVNGESFGFDTIRMKENNLRLHFQDTSTSASFPTNDWRLVANDSSNGGANYLGIEDSTAGRIPFRVEAGARANALYVEDDGDVGIGTNTPVVNLHAVDGNTPTLRLEQDGSSGFTPQTFDIAANEANFFIRDVTNGSQLPFRIFPGSGNNDALVIRANGDVGMGTASPGAAMHVRRTDNTGAMLIEDTGTSFSVQLEMRKANTPRIRFDNSTVDAAPTAGGNDLAAEWDIGLDASSNFLMRSIAQNNNAFSLTDGGNLTVTGTVTPGSDKNSKMAFEDIDASEILAKVVEMPITSWTYKADAETGIRHIGPMSQDFYEMFGTGGTDKGISVTDSAGVALAAIQALQAQNEELRARLDKLEASDQ